MTAQIAALFLTSDRWRNMNCRQPVRVAARVHHARF